MLGNREDRKAQKLEIKKLWVQIVVWAMAIGIASGLYLGWNEDGFEGTVVVALIVSAFVLFIAAVLSPIIWID